MEGTGIGDGEGWADDRLPSDIISEPGLRSYEDLRVWQDGISLCERVYTLTATFPPDEQFGLTAQLRRAAVSIPSNIAEGWGCGTRKDYIRFLCITRGSLYETRTQIGIAERIGLLSGNQSTPILSHVDHLRKMLNGLLRSLTPEG